MLTQFSLIHTDRMPNPAQPPTTQSNIAKANVSRRILKITIFLRREIKSKGNSSFWCFWLSGSSSFKVGLLLVCTVCCSHASPNLGTSRSSCFHPTCRCRRPGQPSPPTRWLPSRFCLPLLPFPLDLLRHFQFQVKLTLYGFLYCWWEWGLPQSHCDQCDSKFYTM